MPRRKNYSLDETANGRVWDFILSYKRRHDGCAPTLRDIMQGTGIKTTSHASFCLDALAHNNLITRQGKGNSRVIQVVGGCWLAPGERAVERAEEDDRE